MRLAVGRRIKELTAAFRDRLGLDADDPVTSAAVDRAAQLTALAEQAAARSLRGEVGYDDTVRLCRLADISVRRLHLDRRNAKQMAPSLADYLRARGDQQ
jgi:hypothetical protein